MFCYDRRLLVAYFFCMNPHDASAAESEQFMYKFDIYLSLGDRSGRPVERNKILAIKNEILGRFGGLTMTSTFGNPVYDGFWTSPESRRVAHDKNSIFTVLAPQSEDTLNFFIGRHKKWETFLNYEKLLITVHELQVL